MTTVAVVGLGSMGQRYLNHFKHTGADVYGCDVRPETFPKGVLCFETLDQLVTEIVPTIAVIASPAAHHLSALYTLREAYPSCSILLEKPVSDGPLGDDDRGRCLTLGGIIAVGYCWRFHPFAQQMRAVRGYITSLTLHVASDMRTWPGQNYADPLREFSHELDLVNYLTLSPRLTKVRHFQGEYCIDGEHKRGRWRVRIAPFHAPDRWVQIQMSDGTIIKKHWERDQSILDAMYSAQASELQNARDENDLTCPLSDGLKTTLLVDEIEQYLSNLDPEWVVM